MSLKQEQRPMNTEDKAALRDLRDNIANEEDKRLLRRIINYVETLESRISTVRTLMRTAMNEISTKRAD